MFRWSKAIVTILTVAALFAVSACSNDSEEIAGPGESAPALPNMSTMQMDLSFFGIDKQSAKEMQPELMKAEAGEHANWIQAVVRVLFVQLTIFDLFEEPIGAFAVAIHSVPQPQEDGSYLWTFIFVEETVEYSIFLYGKEVGDHVSWRMEVSSNDPQNILDHFVWFEGRSQLDDSSGYWQFYVPTSEAPAVAMAAAPMTEGVEALRIDWTNNGRNDGELSILVNLEGSDEEGDRIVFRETPSSGLVEYNDADLQEVHSIMWSADGSGSITVPDYNNGQQACWDTQQVDTPCP